MSILPLAVPPLAAPVEPPVPAAAPPVVVPLTEPPDPPDPAVVLLVVPVVCEAEVLWFVVALGLMVTLLCGIALKRASVFTVVLALGFVV